MYTVIPITPMAMEVQAHGVSTGHLSVGQWGTTMAGDGAILTMDGMTLFIIHTTPTALIDGVYLIMDPMRADITMGIMMAPTDIPMPHTGNTTLRVEMYVVEEETVGDPF